MSEACLVYSSKVFSYFFLILWAPPCVGGVMIQSVAGSPIPWWLTASWAAGGERRLAGCFPVQLATGRILGGGTPPPSKFRTRSRLIIGVGYGFVHILLRILSYCGSSENSNAWLLTGLSMKVLHIQKDFINWDSSKYQNTVPPEKTFRQYVNTFNLDELS